MSKKSHDNVKTLSIHVPHWRSIGRNSQVPLESHRPATSPSKQKSPHCLPLHPCSTHGFSIALTQTPNPSHTPWNCPDGSGTVQETPHVAPLQVTTEEIDARFSCNMQTTLNSQF